MISKSPKKRQTIAVNIKRLLAIGAFLLGWTSFINGQSTVDSCPLQISLLTCSPGEELYSSWGHTAIRVIDSSTSTDIVFNYGTFDDSDPLFLARFTKGLMIYSLSAYPFSEFVEEYKYYKRGVIEQILNVDCQTKHNLFEALRRNYAGNNRFYNYYFKSDNCTTRARDILMNSIGKSLQLGQVIPKEAPTFRNLIHEYLDSSKQFWSKLGIDILLGATLDKKVNNLEAMFLPDFLMKGFDSASVGNTQIVSGSKIILPIPNSTASTSLFTPTVVLWIISIFLIILGFSKKKSATTTLLIFDRIFFAVLGVLGVLLLTLWIIRIDTVCRNNFNLLWALPTHLIIAFVPWRKRWVKTYFKAITILTIALLVLFVLLPQQLNTALIPIILLIAIRSRNRSK
jgi:Domain of unknown function (DUF4105)